MQERSETFWESSDQVERFAGREPDRRLLDLLASYPQSGATRVLDLGCAGGRNSVVLAERGFDFYALDASAAMVEKTRERVATVIGAREATRRVRRGRMDDLGEYDSEWFDLVVALGIYHGATSQRQFDLALDETARVLVPGGSLLVANFAPGTDLTGEGMQLIEGELHLYTGHPSGPLFLLTAEELDARAASHELVPVVPSETVQRRAESGRRVTVNSLYRKRPG